MKYSSASAWDTRSEELQLLINVKPQEEEEEEDKEEEERKMMNTEKRRRIIRQLEKRKECGGDEEVTRGRPVAIAVEESETPSATVSSCKQEFDELPARNQTKGRGGGGGDDESNSKHNSNSNNNNKKGKGKRWKNKKRATITAPRSNRWWRYRKLPIAWQKMIETIVHGLEELETVRNDTEAFLPFFHLLFWLDSTRFDLNASDGWIFFLLPQLAPFSTDWFD